MIKAVFFDFDGTLFSKNKNTNEYARKALVKLREKGILVFLATGRHFFMDIPDETDFSFTYDGYVMLNGQLCICEDEVIYESVIPEKTVGKLLRYLENYEISCVFLKRERLYANTDTVKWFEGAKIEKGNIPPNDVLQIVAFVDDEDQKTIENILPECRTTRWNSEGIDIINRLGSKRIGVEKIAKYFHLRQDEIMAFGDGENDIEMITYAGIGIAMGNAEDEVKKVADYVCEPVDRRGVYEGLLHYHIIEE